MVKRTILLLGILFFVVTFAYAEEKCSLSGVVYFEYDSNIYINIVSRESFPNRLEPLPPPFGMYIKLTPEQILGKCKLRDVI
jgi:hypothetical protein